MLVQETQSPPKLREILDLHTYDDLKYEEQIQNPKSYALHRKVSIIPWMTFVLKTELREIPPQGIHRRDRQ